MKTKTKLICWGIFLLLSVLWWFAVPWKPDFIAAFTIKLIIWAFFFAGGILMADDDSEGYDAEWQ